MLRDRIRFKPPIEICSGDYYQPAVRGVRGHEPHILAEAFGFHERFMTTGDMHSP